MLCSWLAAVPGQPPRLSRLPVPNSGMWVTLCPHNGESSPKGKGFQPKATGGGLRAPVTELIPKTKSFSSRMTVPLPITRGKGLCGTNVVPFGRLVPWCFVLSQLSQAELSPIPGVPRRVLPDSFPVSFGPQHPGCLRTGTALAEKLISHQTPLLEITIRAGLLELSDLFSPPAPLPKLGL